MKKITVKLTAIVLSAFIFLGGVGGSYIEGYCADSGTRFLDVVWNYDDSVAGNLLQYVGLCLAWSYAVAEPTLLGEATDGAFATAEFLHYMNSDKGVELTEEEISQYFEENVRIHGGGGLSFSDDIVDALHHTAQAILDEQGGYWLYPTVPVDAIDPSLFYNDVNYKTFIDFVKRTDYIFISPGAENLSCLDGTEFYALNSTAFANKEQCKIGAIKPDWTTDSAPNSAFQCLINSNWSAMGLNRDWTSFDLSNTRIVPNSSYVLAFYHWFCSSDGRYLRVWKSVDDYKSFSIYRQPYYCTPEWVNYDYSQDNSVTISNTYLGNVTNGGVVNNYYNVVQDAIDKNNTDGNLTEDQIRDIVADTIKQIQQDNNTESDSGGSGSDDNGSGGGIIAIIEGIGKFFDTLLTLVGNVIGMIADFGNSVLEMFGSLGTFTEGFSSFLTGTFGFIPEEVWKVLISGITLSVLLLGIKLFK